jgi:hypothetical protein
MKPSFSQQAGSVAIEVIAFGILAPTLIVVGALQILADQRSHLVAQQAARELVRMSVLNELDSETQADIQSNIADEIGVGMADVRLEVAESTRSGRQLITATATVNGATEVARMFGEK